MKFKTKTKKLNKYLDLARTLKKKRVYFYTISVVVFSFWCTCAETIGLLHQNLVVSTIPNESLKCTHYKLVSPSPSSSIIFSSLKQDPSICPAFHFHFIVHQNSKSTERNEYDEQYLNFGWGCLCSVSSLRKARILLFFLQVILRETGLSNLGRANSLGEEKALN